MSWQLVESIVAVSDLAKKARVFVARGREGSPSPFACQLLHFGRAESASRCTRSLSCTLMPFRGAAAFRGFWCCSRAPRRSLAGGGPFFSSPVVAVRARGPRVVRQAQHFVPQTSYHGAALGARRPRLALQGLRFATLLSVAGTMATRKSF